MVKRFDLFFLTRTKRFLLGDENISWREKSLRTEALRFGRSLEGKRFLLEQVLKRAGTKSKRSLFSRGGQSGPGLKISLAMVKRFPLPKAQE